ncbi:hypothetical protein BDV25DRAFT_161769 [Aspergillus avenaceus]|uniref:Secreted protein n=1 Tax=Aspergillus avenaceus TaxID=36643 RepID=A0A5N6TKE8_ASPAV|nr:hypothetical protein BDV25DRAFT_161769 [Aspergillus avenaceus]
MPTRASSPFLFFFFLLSSISLLKIELFTDRTRRLFLDPTASSHHELLSSQQSAWSWLRTSSGCSPTGLSRRLSSAGWLSGPSSPGRILPSPTRWIPTPSADAVSAPPTREEEGRRWLPRSLFGHPLLLFPMRRELRVLYGMHRML